MRDDGRHRNGREHATVSRASTSLPAFLVLLSVIVVAALPIFDRTLGNVDAGLGAVIVMAVGIAVVLLGLSTVAGGWVSGLLLTAAAVAALISHPGLDAALGVDWEAPIQSSRMVLASLAAAGVMIAARSAASPLRPVHALAASPVVATVTLGVIHIVAPGDHLIAAMILASSMASVLGGVLAHLAGTRNRGAGIVAVGVLVATAGVARTLWLIAGDGTLTVGAFLVASVGVLFAIAAAMVAFTDALARRDEKRDLERLSRSVQLARLTAESDRHAELLHDQRSSLLAIEAAARSLMQEPSDLLSEAVASEAARLKRRLDEISATVRYFDVVTTVEPLLECARSLPREIRFDHPPEAVAWGNPDEIIETLQVLLDNAHQHGGSPVQVAVTSQPGTVSISVRDGGNGVHPLLREVVFDRGVTTDTASRSGLGLYVARRLARRHGGDLVISPGRPSTFVVTLPVSQPVVDVTVLDLRDSEVQLGDHG